MKVDRNRLPNRGLFVVGTDTEIGKTYVAARIIESLVGRGFSVGAYKPVASGVNDQEASDAQQLWRATGGRGSLEMVNPQVFVHPFAPPIAAELENRTVDESLIVEGAYRWRDHCDVLVIEGAGGLLSPISWNSTNCDVAIQFGFPIVLVASNRLGVVHQVLSTLRVARSSQLDVRAIVLNQPHEVVSETSKRDNRRMLEHFLLRDQITIDVIDSPYQTIRFAGHPEQWLVA